MDYSIFWLIALVLSIVIEIATLGLTTIWFAGGALLAVIAAQYSGYVLRRPNVTIYFALAAACLFSLTRELPSPERGKSPLKKRGSRGSPKPAA